MQSENYGMKIYLSNPRNHWVSPYKFCEALCSWREIDYDEPWVQRVVKILNPVMGAWQKFLDFVHPQINYVKIDRWDTWSMDSTLSPIILPMLKQLKKDKHGSPNVDDEDVPAKLRSVKRKIVSSSKMYNDQDIHKIDDGIDKNFHRRWDYVMDEMIWTFTQLCDWDNDAKFYDHSEANKEKDFSNSIRKIKVDRVGLQKHNERITNGLRLFGKYFRALWD
jgi:hypothetical protein